MSYVRDGLGRYLITSAGRYMKVPPGVSPCYCCCRVFDLLFSGIEVSTDPNCPVQPPGYNPNFAVSPLEPLGQPNTGPGDLTLENDCCRYGFVHLYNEGVKYEPPRPDPGDIVTHSVELDIRLCPPETTEQKGVQSYVYLFYEATEASTSGGPPSGYYFRWVGKLPQWGGTYELHNQNVAICDPTDVGINGKLTLSSWVAP